MTILKHFLERVPDRPNFSVFHYIHYVPTARRKDLYPILKKQRQLARNLESKLIAKCAKQKTLKRPPKKVAKANPKCSGAKSKSTRGGKSGGNDGTKTKEEVMVEFEVAAVKLKVVVVVELNLAFQNQSYL
jgi:hypothetical protein